MDNISLDLSSVKPFIKPSTDADQKLKSAVQLLENKTGSGNDFLGWLELPNQISQDWIEDIKETAKGIISDSEILVVIGIGGSYLGAKAAINALTHSFYNESPNRKTPAIYFAGINLSGSYLNDLLEVIGDKDFSINVISKSGTTTEPAISFRILKERLISKYGKEAASKRIYATTDANRGALKKLANQEGYKSYEIADDIGGRFSVLTAVGLLPIAVAGINIECMINGAKDAGKDSNTDFEKNICHQYALTRYQLYNQGKKIEILVNYEPQLLYIAEWWKQLYGESEGKDGKGIFPAAVSFTSDLHSMGQYIQDGERHLFETIINVTDPNSDITLKSDEQDLDGLNYLAGKTMNYVNQQAMKGTLMAHVDGGVPNIIINVPKLNAYHIGYLIYFFEKACALSGYMIEVNPFDQPGVEAYKSNMFKLLGKAGY